jgi:two-component system, LytTR family, sensor kinase
LALFMCTQDLARMAAMKDPTPWWHFVVSWLAGMYLWALFLAPAVLWLGRRFPLERRRWLRRSLLHLVCSVAFSLLHLVLDSALISLLGIFPTLMKGFWGTFSVLLILGFHGNILTYWIILGIQYGFRTYHQYQERKRHALRLELDASELQSQLVQAQLSALKMQLQPHFLFNTLNAIMVLVRQHKGTQAEEMLARLSDLLRCVLEDVEAQEVPLSRELEYVQLYLSIEQVRFQDRLRVDVSVDPAALDAAVPHMGLQPIVENAIRHGIGRRSAAGKIQIKASRVDGRLEIQIRDDGPGLPADGVLEARGIGLANTRARLEQLYDGQASLRIENAAEGGAVVTLSLPYRPAPEAAEAGVLELHALENADRR